EALQLWTERHVREIKEVSSGSVHEGYLQLAGQVKVHPEADDLIAFLLKYFLVHHRMEKAQASLTGSASRPEPAPSVEVRSERSDRGPRGRTGRERPGRDRSEHRERPPRRARPEGE